jgi:hypothetical protein
MTEILIGAAVWMAVCWTVGMTVPCSERVDGAKECAAQTAQDEGAPEAQPTHEGGEVRGR